jgi:hypothetical protein
MIIVIGATARVTKVVKKNLEAIPEKHAIDAVKKTVMLGTSQIIQNILVAFLKTVNICTFNSFSSTAKCFFISASVPILMNRPRWHKCLNWLVSMIFITVW